MIKIKDNAKNFVKFIDLCSAGGTFKEIYCDVAPPYIISRMKTSNNVSLHKIIYMPDSILETGKVEVILDEDTGEGVEECVIWGEIDKIKSKLKNAKSGDITIEFDGNNFLFSIGGSRKKLKTCIPKELRESYNFAIDIEKTNNLDKDLRLSGFFVSDDDDRKGYHLKDVDSKLFKEAIAETGSFSKFSYYTIKILPNGKCYLVLIDSDDKNNPDFSEWYLGKIDNDGKEEVSSDFLLGFDGIFGTLDGDVDVYFGRDSPMIVTKTIENKKKSLVKGNVFDILYITTPKVDEDEVGEDEDLEKVISEIEDEIYDEDEIEIEDEDNETPSFYEDEDE